MHVGILGTGAWGTALALACGRGTGPVTLWARRPEMARRLAETSENAAHLPGLPLDPAPRLTADLADLTDADLVLLAVPAQHLRAAAAALGPHLRPRVPLVICAKGIELETGLMMSELLAAELPDHPAGVLSGPSFAAETARGLPTALTLAISNRSLGSDLLSALASPRFRPYLSDDIIGAQIGGALKNVMAIAAGICVGRGLGENARAALVTRGLAEMTRLARALGGRAATLRGLSGLGDLVLTCGSHDSRNMSLGVELGRGRSLAAILGARSSVSEGVPTAPAVLARARKAGIDMPICQAMEAILHHGEDIDRTIAALLDRPLRDEAE